MDGGSAMVGPSSPPWVSARPGGWGPIPSYPSGGGRGQGDIPFPPPLHFNQGYPPPLPSSHHQYQHHHAANPRKLFTCGPCNRTYYSKFKLDEHMKDHVECPFPECKLSANARVIDNHINNQHMLVNFANLQIDDETWRAERKKRFPTAERAELRRQKQMEKLQRGEKLGKTIKPFARKTDKFNKAEKGRLSQEKKQARPGKPAHTGKCEGGDVKQQKQQDTQKVYHKREKQAVRPQKQPYVEVDILDSDTEEKDGIPAFPGTKQFYESTGEVSYFGSKNMADTDKEEKGLAEGSISDDEEWAEEGSRAAEITAAQKPLVCSGGLGSLMMMYSDSEEEEQKGEKKTLTQVVTEPPPDQAVISQTLQNKANTKDYSEALTPAEVLQVNRQRGKHRHRRHHHHHKGHKRPHVGGGPKPPPPYPKRRKTLLERLLLPDIIHERNVILQCVRYIIENNFFEEGEGKNSDIDKNNIVPHDENTSNLESHNKQGESGISADKNASQGTENMSHGKTINGSDKNTHMSDNTACCGAENAKNANLNESDSIIKPETQEN